MLVHPAPQSTSENGNSEKGISALSGEVLKSDVRSTGSAASLLNDTEAHPVEESADVNNNPSF